MDEEECQTSRDRRDRPESIMLSGQLRLQAGEVSNSALSVKAPSELHPLFSMSTKNFNARSIQC